MPVIDFWSGSLVGFSYCQFSFHCGFYSDTKLFCLKYCFDQELHLLQNLETLFMEGQQGLTVILSFTIRHNLSSPNYLCRSLSSHTSHVPWRLEERTLLSLRSSLVAQRVEDLTLSLLWLMLQLWHGFRPWLGNPYIMGIAKTKTNKQKNQPYFFSLHLGPCFFLKAIAGKFPRSIWQMPVDQILFILLVWLFFSYSNPVYLKG